MPPGPAASVGIDDSHNGDVLDFILRQFQFQLLSQGVAALQLIQHRRFHQSFAGFFRIAAIFQSETRLLKESGVGFAAADHDMAAFNIKGLNGSH